MIADSLTGIDEAAVATACDQDWRIAITWPGAAPVMICRVRRDLAADFHYLTSQEVAER